MAAYWYTYSVNFEYDDLVQELDEEYANEQEEDLALDRYATWLDDEKDLFYADIERVFLKFYYRHPTPAAENRWCQPNFRVADPLGLFYRAVDDDTFRELRRVFALRSTPYRAIGTLHLAPRMIETLFRYAGRWCDIHVLYYAEDDDYNYKLTVWVASRIVAFLAD